MRAFIVVLIAFSLNESERMCIISNISISRLVSFLIICA